MVSYPCPSPQRWQALLLDDLPPAEQIELNGHLEVCPDCQRLLEDCAADRDSWADAPRYLGQSGPTREQPLRDLMDRLKNDPDGEPTAAALPLDFLDPSDRPGVLGRLGPYEILEEIGCGGMGIVLKALDPALHRVVALKVLAPQLAVSATARKRFTREGRAAAAVCHEHVITIHAVEEFKGLPYLVMQYVAGLSLQQKLEETGPLPVAEVLRIGMQTAAGLAAAHAQGLIHRDVKPANILLENGVERVQLTDFSLARAVDDASVTQSGVVSGTPQYMAPEQARGEPLDARADLFSLGSVLYVLCTGRPPFRGHALEVLRKVSEDTPKPIRSQNPDIPAWLEAIVMKLMAKKPEARFGSAAEVADLLERCLAHVQQPTTVPLPPIPGHAPPRRSHRVATAVCVLAGLFVVSEGTGFTQVVKTAAIVLRLKTPDGTLVVEIDDPNVQVTLDGNDAVITGVGIKEVRLKPGAYRLVPTKGGQQGKDEIVTISQGERKLVKVSFEPAAGAAQAARLENVHGAELCLRCHNAAVPTPAHLMQDIPFLHRLYQFSDVAQRDKALGDWVRHHAVQAAPATGMRITDPARTITTGHKGAVTALAFTPDGKRLATAGADGVVNIFDTDTGKLALKMQGHEQAIRSAAISPDGRLLASAGSDGTVRLWDVATGAQVRSLNTQIRHAITLRFTPDGTKIAVGGQADASRVSVVELLPVASTDTTLTFALAAPVLELAFPPGRPYRLAVGLETNDVHIFDLGTTRESYVVSQPGQVHKLAFSPDGRWRATSTLADGQVTLWDWQWGRQAAVLPAHGGYLVGGLTFSPDGKLLLTTGADGKAKLWDVTGNTPGLLHTYAAEKRTGSVWSATFAPDGKTIVTAGSDGVLRLWDVNQPRPDPRAAPAPATRPGEKRVRMEFRGKPWREVLDWLSQQAGLSVVGNVRPTGAFTFIPTRPDYSIAEVFDILNEALIQQRFLLIRRQATFTLVPADEPIDPLLVPRVRADELKDRGQTEMVSVAYALKTLRADDTIAKEIKRLMGPFGEVIPQPTSKLLILRDTAGNLRRIIETLELAEKGAAAPGPADKPEKRLKFEVRDKSWPAVLQWFSQETGLPRIGSSVTGTFTITPPPKPEGYTIPEVIDILNEALMQQKYILIRRAASYTIAPADEPIDPWLLPRVAADELKDRGKTELVNLGYRLKTVNAGEMVSEVKKMLGPLGQVVPLERRNELALMDTVGNLRRIVEALDGVEKKQAEKRIRFEFRDRAGALNWLSQQTGLPLITTNMPTSTVGFVPPVKPEGYTIPEVIDLLNEGLLLQKYVLIRCEASLTILPVDEKIDPSIPPRITLDDLKDRGKTELVSVVLPLKSMTAKDAAPEIKRMMGALGEITVLSNNQLVVQDTVGNLRRVVAALDAVEKDKKDPAAPDR